MKEEKLIMLRGQSVFAPYIADFVRQKRALGWIILCDLRTSS